MGVVLRIWASVDVAAQPIRVSQTRRDQPGSLWCAPCGDISRGRERKISTTVIEAKTAEMSRASVNRMKRDKAIHVSLH